MTATPQARTAGTRLPRQARRRQLLGAAQEVFVAQGYHAAAMDEIAERAEVSKPVLYQHFPGKLDLYLALLDESVEALTDTIRNALASTTDNKQRVSATFEAFFGFVASTGEAFRLVFESDLRNEPAVRDRLDAAMRVHADMISEFIREDAGLGDDHAHLLGIGLVGMVGGDQDPVAPTPDRGQVLGTFEVDGGDLLLVAEEVAIVEPPGHPPEPAERRGADGARAGVFQGQAAHGIDPRFTAERVDGSGGP